MKFLFSVFTLLFLGQHTFAQAQAYKLDYIINFDEELTTAIESPSSEESADLINLRSLMDLVKGGKSVIEAWVTPDHYRLKSIFTDTWVVLGDKVNKTLYQINFGDSTYLKIENPVGVFANDETEAELEGFDIEFVPGKTEMIAGFPCKLAVLTPLDYDFSQEEMATIELWYTERIEPFVWGNFTFLKQLPGAVLKMNLGIGHFEASKISLEDVTADFFQVPSDFKLMENKSSTVDMEDMELGEDLIAYYDTLGGYYGLKHVTNGVLTPPNFMTISEFRSSVSIAADTSGMFGLINTKGESILPFVYDIILYDEEVQAYTYAKDQQYSLMDKSGKQLWTSSFDYLGTFIGDLAVITSKDLNGLVNKDGIIVLPAKYESIYEFNPTHFTTITGEEFQLYELKTQKLLIDGFKELYLANAEDLFIASKDGETYGLVNSKGQMVIPFIYSMINSFVDGKAEVMKAGFDEIIYINTKGEEVKEEED
ncbi:WG repeat-containing protein [Sphingobacterium sp. HJSM2_6]|uniref:WG repeat-containing protein n=1 Tax=Sphingobacterium sp. HJSM2_6 TaxID=3366264 RepID=UPI003BD2A52F